MIGTKIPNSLRQERAESWAVGNDNAGKYTAVVAGFIAATAFSSAEAQQAAPLPPVNVDVPTTRAKPAASKPSPDALRARTALRRAARRAAPTTAAPAVPYPNAGGLQAPNQNPYADAAAPYKVDRLQASGKFPEPLLNTPKTVTVLTKELLADKNATSLKQAVVSTAGVTLGTGEGGNAFGDRFFIRGFDARNDVFVDGVRDAGVSVRENFFTEQVEILRGPGSSYAGRGTTGGAINIVTKQARTDRSFYGMDTTIGTDSTRRITLDANQVITPSLAVRAGGLFQEAGVAGRDFTTDNRNGGYVATKWTPLDTVKITTDYIHTGISAGCRITQCRGQHHPGPDPHE
jgi:catecholate siderophore receptor